MHSRESEVEVGSPVCIISDAIITNKKIKEIRKTYSKQEKTSSDRVISKKAKILIDKYNINVDSIDDEIISEKVVIEYIEKVNPKEKVKYSFKENDIVIYGIGGHAGMCIDIIKKIASSTLLVLLMILKRKIQLMD